MVSTWNLKLQPARYRQLPTHCSTWRMATEVLPVTAFSLHDAADAYSGFWHPVNDTGKIVISIQHGSTRRSLPRHHFLWSAATAATSSSAVRVVSDSSARWLAEQGAGLIFNGRSAPSDAAAAIAELNASGSRIEVITGDITELDTERLVRAVEDVGPAGRVVHSAMVLADEIVLNMTDSAARRVFALKVTGSWRTMATAARDVDRYDLLLGRRAGHSLGRAGARRRQLVGSTA